MFFAARWKKYVNIWSSASLQKSNFIFAFPIFYFLCVLPVVQYQEADNSSGFFGLQWDQGQQCNDNMTQERAQVRRLHAPHKTLPCPVQTGRRI